MYRKFEDSKGQLEGFLKQLFTRHQDDHKVFSSVGGNSKNTLNLESLLPQFPRQMMGAILPGMHPAHVY